MNSFESRSAFDLNESLEVWPTMIDQALNVVNNVLPIRERMIIPAYDGM
jgi:hypothetical protein